MTPLGPRSVLLVTLLALGVLVQADYFIDDANLTAIQYSSNPGAGPVWGPFPTTDGEGLSIEFPNGSLTPVPTGPCYDGTFTYAACETTDQCKLQFSFTGSGVTLYVLQAGGQGISASISIDNGSPTTKTLDAPPGPQYYQTNVSLYDIQSLSSTSPHSLSLQVLSWNGIFSGMMFDYAFINQTVVPLPTLSSSISASPTTSTASPSSSATAKSSSGRSHVGTIVGVVIAIAAAISLVVFTILFYRRRRNVKKDRGPRVDIADSSPIAETHFEVTPFLPDIGAASASQSSSHLPPPRSVKGQQTTQATLTSDLSTILHAHNPLTDEQIDFANGLFANNVPVPTIARMLERMIHAANTDLPPSYE